MIKWTTGLSIIKNLEKLWNMCASLTRTSTHGLVQWRSDTGEIRTLSMALHIVIVVVVALAIVVVVAVVVAVVGIE